MSSDNGSRAPRPRRPRCSSCSQRRRRELEAGRGEAEFSETFDPSRLRAPIHWLRSGSPVVLCLEELE